MKHDHWDISECKYCSQEEAQTDESLHTELVAISSLVESLLRSLEAEEKVNLKEFRGMGYGLVIKDAGKKRGYIRALKQKLNIEDYYK